MLVCGKSATGKSMALRNIKDQEGVIYCNTESGKKLPFKSKFKKMVITDPMQVFQVFDQAEQMPEVHTIIIDSLTYLMDMYESVYVLTSANTMKAWGDYAQFFRTMMQQYVAKSTKNVIFTAHTMDVMNEAEMAMETLVKVKGALMNNGVESWFSNIISCKKMPVMKLENYGSDFLTINEEEEMLGFKYVFQTRLTKESVNERIRAPLQFWSIKETYIDNDLQFVIERLNEYYKED